MTIEDEPTQERPGAQPLTSGAELPTELRPPVDYPSTPQAYSAAQDLPTVRIPVWRHPWTRVGGGLLAALVTVAGAAYLAGGATHARIVVEHAPPVTVTKTVIQPGPPDDDAYVAALKDQGIGVISRSGMLATAHNICVDLIHSEPRRLIIEDVMTANPGLDQDTAIAEVNTSEKFYCPHSAP